MNFSNVPFVSFLPARDVHAVCLYAGNAQLRGEMGKTQSITSVDKHMTSILKAAQWKSQVENNVWPSVWPLVLNLKNFLYI